MKKTVTRKWFNNLGACYDGIEWVMAQPERDSIKLLRVLMKPGKYDWANWLIVRLMNERQKVQYTIFAAELVLEHFEEHHPEDKRPRKAIEAARAYLKRPNEKTKSAAWSAAWSARSAESATRSAWSAARSAAWSAAWSAESATRSAESATRSAESATYKSIINYGIKILKGF